MPGSDGELKRLVGAQPDSRVIVYYSGHGATNSSQSETYILPVDAEPYREERSGYPLSTLYANLAALNAKSVLVLLESSFGRDHGSYILPPNLAETTRSALPPQPLSKVTILASADRGQRALIDTSYDIGLFTRYLIEGLAGSADLYQRNQETPLNSINFVTSHDGFTLNDLVSYARKHNEANGEGNRDGTDENYSDNNGVEGPSDDPQIEAVRLRQIRNLLVSLFVSRGVPMLLGGDEFRRTQLGNNNAYCQDTETSWYDWRLVEGNAGLIRFVSGLIAFRKEHPVLSAERFYSEREITWLGADGQPPDWQGPDNRIGCLIAGTEEQLGPLPLALLFNAGLRPCRFGLPPQSGGHWRVAVDTSRSSPDDLPEPDNWAIITHEVIELDSRSAMILVADPCVADA